MGLIDQNRTLSHRAAKCVPVVAPTHGHRVICVPVAYPEQLRGFNALRDVQRSVTPKHFINHRLKSDLSDELILEVVLGYNLINDGGNVF